MKTLGIFGTSGFAREVDDIAGALGWHTAFIARDAAEREAWSGPGEVLLESELVHTTGWQFTIGIGDNAVRQKVAQRYSGQLDFINLLHPSASFGRGQQALIDAQRGVIVCAGVRFANNIRVGDFSIFNLNATVGHDVIVDSFVNISPGANISGNVHICSRCWVGTGAAINQGTPETKLIIGADTMVGSGSVVVRDCEPGAVYVGIPAKRIK
jgi:sugar O-acyltransferase (sialic acid O-acetyltransferase NeuD family)